MPTDDGICQLISNDLACTDAVVTARCSGAGGRDTRLLCTIRASLHAPLPSWLTARLRNAYVSSCRRYGTTSCITPFARLTVPLHESSASPASHEMSYDVTG